MVAHIVEGALTYPGAELADGYAAHIYANPSETDQIIDHLDNALDLYISHVGLDNSHVTVEHIVNRTRHKAVSASLFHLAELAASTRFLDAWNTTTLDFDMSAYANGLPDSGPTAYPFEEPYERYIAIESGVDIFAAQSVMRAVQKQSHPYHPVWLAYTHIQPEFARTDYLTRGFRRQDSTEADFMAAFARLPTDTLLPFLMPPALQFHREGMNGEAITRKLLSRSEEFSWASTLSRRTRMHRFPDAGESANAVPSCPYAIADEDRYVSAHLGDHFWNRVDLQGLPRESSSFCPVSNNVELISKEPADRKTTDAIYDVQAAFITKRILSRKPGAGCAAEMHAIRTIPLLGKTVFSSL